MPEPDDVEKEEAGGLARFARKDLVFLGVVVLMALLVAWQTCRIVELKVAYQGWGPPSYVAMTLDPDGFADDWPSGIGNYRHSAPMRVYEWLARYAGVEPAVAMYPYIAVVSVLFALAVALLGRTVLGSRQATLVCVAAVLCAPVAGLNLARFHKGWGASLDELYYGPAHAAQVAALAFALRRSWITAFVLLAVTAWCHVMIGFMTCVFAGAVLLTRPRDLLDRRVLIGAGVFALLFAPQLVWILRDVSVGSGGVPAEAWVVAGRIFSWHFFPFDFEAFTENADDPLFPILLVSGCLLLRLAAPFEDDAQRERVRRILAGCLACVALTAAGIAISRLAPVPFLVKMSLHRASGLVTFFAVVLFSGYLWDAIERRHIVAALLAAWTVAMLVMTGPGVCVLPPLALLGADVLRRYGDAPNKVPLALFWTLALGVVLVAWVNVACTLWDASPLHAVGDRLWKPLRLLNPLLDDDLLLRGGRFHRTLGAWAALGAAVLLAAGGRVPYMRWGVPVLCVAGVLANHAIRSGNWLINYGHDARRLFEVQRWAHETTAPDALFIVDPTRNYGWRDYAKRSCFGFYREWGFFAFMYDADETLYEEGRRRLALFGADMDEIATRHLAAGTPMHRVKLEVQGIVSEGFRATSTGGWLEIAGEYGADYLVFPVPAEGPPALDLPVAFENDAYIVFSLNPGE